MAIRKNQPATSAGVNREFMSRRGNTDTIGKVDLKNAESAEVIDLQKVINDLKTEVYDRKTPEIVQDLEALDAFPEERRRPGMIVFVATENQNYQLIENEWKKLSGSGGILTVANDQARLDLPATDRYVGLIVHIQDEDINWQLTLGIENENWKQVPRSFYVSEEQTLANDSDLTLNKRVREYAVVKGAIEGAIVKLPNGPTEVKELLILCTDKSVVFKDAANLFVGGKITLRKGQTFQFIWNPKVNLWSMVGV